MVLIWELFSIAHEPCSTVNSWLGYFLQPGELYSGHFDTGAGLPVALHIRSWVIDILLTAHGSFSDSVVQQSAELWIPWAHEGSRRLREQAFSGRNALQLIAPLCWDLHGQSLETLHPLSGSEGSLWPKNLPHMEHLKHYHHHPRHHKLPLLTLGSHCLCPSFLLFSPARVLPWCPSSLPWPTFQIILN